MTTEPQEPRQEAEFFTTIRNWGIVRGENGVLGGVVEGVGTRIGMDRVPARLLTVLLAIVLFPPTILAYGAAWGLLPDSEGNIIIQNFGRGRPNVGALIGIAIMTLAGLGGLNDPVSFHVGDDWFSFGNIWGALVALGVIGLVLWLVLRNRDDASKVYATPPAAPSANSGMYATPPARATATPAATTAPAATATGRGTVKKSPGAAKAASASTTAAAPESKPASTASPVAATPVPRPAPKPRVPGPGAAIYLLTLAATVLAAAGVWWLDRTGELSVSPVAAFFALLVVIVGAAIIITGAAGRKIGFLGFIATTLIIGWVIGLSAPGIGGWLDEHVHLSINDTSIDAGVLNDDELREAAFRCTEFDPEQASAVASSADQTFTLRGGDSVDVINETNLVLVPADARVTITLGDDYESTATVMWASEGLSCNLWGAGDQITLGNGTTDLYLTTATADTAIVIEGS